MLTLGALRKMTKVNDFLEFTCDDMMDFKLTTFDKDFKILITEDRKKVCDLLLDFIQSGRQKAVVSGTPGIG